MDDHQIKAGKGKSPEVLMYVSVYTVSHPWRIGRQTAST